MITPPRPARALTHALLGATLVASSFANGTRLPNQNAEATARGNAFVATADNPSAIYYNPAGLAQLEGVQVQSDSYAILARYDYVPAGGGSRVEADRQIAVIPQLYASWSPADSPFSYGIGVYSPFGQSSEWPDDSGFRSIATRNEVVFITVAPTVAWQVCERLSVGVGLQVNNVEADLQRGLLPSPGIGDRFRFRGDDTSFGYNIGVLWKPSERHVFGLNYQSRSTSEFKGTVDVSPPGISVPGSVDLPFPDIITLGYSWRPTPDWNIEIAVDRTNWDLLNTVTLNSSLGPQPIPFEWHASYYYLLGATRRLADGWRVSAGYCYSENSSPDPTFNPAVPDMNRHLASLGVGRDIGAFSLFLTYQHGFKATREVSGVAPNGAGETPNGRYESTLDALSFSLRYAF